MRCRGFLLTKNYIMTEKDSFVTLNEDEFTIYIGEMTGKLIVKPNSNLTFEKEEVADLIKILKYFYDRMD
jgi:hypothetical protein